MSQVPASNGALTDEDYRLLVHVVESVDRSPDISTFKRQLARALRRWLGHRAVAVIHCGSLDEANRDDAVIEGYPERFLDTYEQQWASSDPLRDRQALRALVERGVVAVGDLPLTAAHQVFVDEFLRPNGITSKFAVRIDCEPHGSVHLAVVPDESRSPARTTALLQALRRHLMPIAGRLLADDHASVWQLTARERQVAALVADGLTNQQIAERLVVGVHTVKKHLTRVLAETGCSSRTQLAVRWEQRSATTVRPHQLPPSTGRFVGRTDELATLDLLLAARDRAEPAVAVIEGMAGTGKTSLALRWANRRREAFDLDLFLDLRGYAEADPLTPADALSMLLRSLGVPTAAIPPELELRATLLRSSLGHRGRALVVLDNARDAEQIRPLLPGNGVVVLVTSRTQLRGLVAREGTIRVTLREFPETDAVELFTAITGQARTGGEPAAVAELTALCGHLPLAVALAAERAARLEHVPLVAHARELSDERSRLRALSSPTDPGTDIAAALSLSVRTLSPEAARMFRFLGLHPGSAFGVDSAAAALDVSLDEASAVLDELVMAHLLTHAGPARFRFHDLVRLHARNLADEPGPHAAALERLVDWYVAGAGRAALAINRSDTHRERFAFLDNDDARLPRFATEREGRNWFHRERDALLGVAQQAVDQHWDDRAWQLSHLLFDLFIGTFDLENWLRIGEAGMRSARRLGSTEAIVHAADSVGVAYVTAGRWDDALDTFRLALDRCTADGDDDGVAWMLGNMGRAHASRGDHVEAADHLERALECQPRDDRYSTATILAHLAKSRVRLGDHDQAVESAAAALALYEHRFGRGIAHLHLAEAYAGLGDLTEAELAAGTAVLLLRESGRPHRLVEALTLHGRLLFGLGRAGDALAAWKQALGIAEPLQLPAAEQVRTLLEEPAPISAR